MGKTFLSAVQSRTVSKPGPKRSPINGIPHNLTLEALSPGQVFSQSALLAELARAADHSDMWTDSAEASAMYAIPRRNVGKDDRIVSLAVPASMCS